MKLALLILALAAPQDAAKERLVLRTNLGDLAFVLYPGVAPRHVEQILALARAGVFDTAPALRVHPGFLVQFADHYGRMLPLLPSQRRLIRKLPVEPSTLKHVRGVLSMTKDSENLAETSFSVLLGDAPQLDGQYTVFGRLEHGWEVLDAISRLEVDPMYVPRKPLEIVKGEIMDANDFLLFEMRGPPAADKEAKKELPDGTRSFVLAIVALLMVIGLAIFLLAGRIPAKAVAAGGLLIVLVGFFFLWVIGVPTVSRAGLSAWAAALFVGALALFKLMGRFEGPRP